MLDTLKDMLANQFEAALCTLRTCIDRCPQDAWEMRIGRYAFSQVAFHTLFYADVYLGPDLESLRQQPFHRDNGKTFADYEELQDREPQTLYDRPFIASYVQHCRQKAAEAIASETAKSLSAPCGFERRAFTRAELYVYTIRHIQHHAAQLILRLRTDANTDIPWFGSGWRA